MSDYAVNQAKDKLEQLLERWGEFKVSDEDLSTNGVIDEFSIAIDEVLYILESAGVEQDDISERNYDKESYMKDQLVMSDYEVVGDEILCPYREEEDGELRGFIEYLSRCGYRFTGLIQE